MTRYQVSVYAEKLPKQGLLHKLPNVYATIQVSGGTRDGEMIGTTEVMYKTCTPDFIKVFFIETDASRNLPITVRIYHTNDMSINDNPNPNQTHQHNGTQLIEATFEVTEVFKAPGHVLSQKSNQNNAMYVSCVCFLLFLFV